MARDQRQDGEAGQEDERRDLGHERDSQRDAEQGGVGRRRSLPEPVGSQDRGQRGAREGHVRSGEAGMGGQVRIEGGGGHGERAGKGPDLPAGGVDEKKQQGQPERGRGAGKEAEGAGIGHTGGAGRLSREHGRHHDRGLGVQPLLAGALADPGVEEALAPRQVERLVVGPSLTGRGPEGVADGAAGEGQGQHVRGPRAHGGQRAPVRRPRGGTPRILHTPRASPRCSSP